MYSANGDEEGASPRVHIDEEPLAIHDAAGRHLGVGNVVADSVNE
jgi:hypothetical protein